MVAKNSGATRSLRSHLFIGLLTAFVLVGGLGGWASYASISGAVIAQGTVIVESRSKRVQHNKGGIISAIYVKEGQRVAASEMLLRLDGSLTRANLAIISTQLDELTARKARLIAQRDAADEIRFPASLMDRISNEDIAQAVNGERSLFEARRNTSKNQKSQLAERIGQLREEIKGLIVQRDAKASEMTFIGDELSDLEGLFKKGHVTKSRMLALRREAARLTGAHGQFVSTIARATGRISETKLQIIQIDQDGLARTAKELREVGAKIIELAERKVAAQEVLNRLEIRAPRSGFVHQLSVYTVGGVIGAGDTVMLIVPEDDRLIIEVQIQPTDIDQVRLGQKAIVRLPAFNQRTTPEMFGEVATIAADLTVDRNTGVGFYVARLILSKDEMEKIDGKKLVPGMPVEAFIQTQSRTALSYLSKPISDHIVRVFREE